MFVIRNEVRLPVPVARVWRLITDFQRYRDCIRRGGSDGAIDRPLFFVVVDARDAHRRRTQLPFARSTTEGAK